ncbi:MAG: N-acetylmuramoyl-L-alanine amidase [Prevotella sp.]|nr:N-acetylmuramoyl-L-alanine amidase [Prevotella sp.]
MRHITEIIVHCTATPAGRHHTAADVDLWHRQRGFRMIGYHYLVLLDGTIQEGRPLTMAGAHCTGHNRNSIGVCYVGGVDSLMQPADTRTPEQRETLRQLIGRLKAQFPEARVLGHCDLAAKACPCFNARKEYGD